MPVEPPRKITDTQIIRREQEEGKDSRRKKKPLPPDEGLKREPAQPGKVDIKV